MAEERAEREQTFQVLALREVGVVGVCKESSSETSQDTFEVTVVNVKSHHAAHFVSVQASKKMVCGVVLPDKRIGVKAQPENSITGRNFRSRVSPSFASNFNFMYLNAPLFQY